MVKVNSNNVWKLTNRQRTKHWFVKCPSKSGAKIFLAEHLGNYADHAPFSAEVYTEEQVPEGEKLIQAKFRAANDPANWKEGAV